MHQNINWLSNKLDRLGHFLNDHLPDLIILTEHGIFEENLHYMNLDGYSLIGGFTRKNHQKGGVLGYAKKEIENQIKLLNTSGAESELICETALFQIAMKKHTIQVLGVYRPPSGNLNHAVNILSAQLEIALQTKRRTILMGDINVDNLVENSDNNKIEELLASFGIVRENLPPTRITVETAKSIDWICTNIDDHLIQTAVITSGLSDHTAQAISVQSQKINPPREREKKRIFNKKSTDRFKTSLQGQNWDSVLLTNDANLAYSNFHEILQQTLNRTCPQITTNRKPCTKIQCWDAECTRLKNIYIQALEREQLTGCIEDKVEAAARKKDYDLRLKLLKRERATAHIEQADNKPKALWQVINNERKAKSNTTIEWKLQTGNETIQDPADIANCFNNFFATIADRTLQASNISLNSSQQDEPAPAANFEFKFQPVTHSDIKKAINSLKPKTSSGIDEISAKLTKICKEEITIPLTDITNKSLQQGIFPDLLKTAKVYPKYKNGENTSTGSYRPISLISTFSKIIEKVVLEKLLLHLQQNNLLTSQQHGFLKGRSTATALIQFTEHIIDELEEGNKVTSLFLDFSKASELISVHRGVPQGSVLGPILYLLLTNDLPSWLQDSCHTVMYADDTAITLAHRSLETLTRNTNTALNITKQYCTTNELVLNEKKTVQLTFTTRNKNNTNITLPDIESKNSTKYLGITIDSSLSWTAHIDGLCKKLSSCTYVIRRLKQISGLEAAKTAYFALFESHMRYGIATWGGTSNTNLERILVQQKRAIRCLANIAPRESCRDAFKELKILTVVSLHIQEVILHAVNTAQLRHRDMHQHNTRHAADFALPTHHLSLFGRKPSYKGAAYFNRLPDHLKQEPIKTLKRKLNLWLQDNPYYTEKEFCDN
ncbi:hypothetical protein J6590_108426 [Homalodisca vitripennis]|nr:hypothetical protein J6590_108426 [Homalodisca vitripennis]